MFPQKIFLPSSIVPFSSMTFDLNWNCLVLWIICLGGSNLYVDSRLSWQILNSLIRLNELPLCFSFLLFFSSRKFFFNWKKMFVILVLGYSNQTIVVPIKPFPEEHFLLIVSRFLACSRVRYNFFYYRLVRTLCTV